MHLKFIFATDKKGAEMKMEREMGREWKEGKRK
jgi:hypothetical protein